MARSSVTGELVQQDYAVRVRLRVGEHRVETTRAAHVLLAPAPSPAGEPLPVVDDAGVAVLGFEDVPSHRLCGGVPVRGTGTVSPSVAGRARGVRVDLLMVEHVSAAPGEPLQEDLGASSPTASRPRRSGPRGSRCAGSCRPSSTALRRDARVGLEFLGATAG